jgi:hypothetical protein
MSEGKVSYHGWAEVGEGVAQWHAQYVVVKDITEGIAHALANESLSHRNTERGTRACAAAGGR